MSISLGIIAGLAALSGLAGTGIGLYQNQVNREFNAQQAQIQREFEERMSSTAYQRASADIREAGLNPAMVLSNSAGASTPSGASASSASASASVNIGSVLSGASSVINALNNDKNESNDVDLKQTLKMISNVASILK